MVFFSLVFLLQFGVQFIFFKIRFAKLAPNKSGFKTPYYLIHIITLQLSPRVMHIIFSHDLKIHEVTRIPPFKLWYTSTLLKLLNNLDIILPLVNSPTLYNTNLQVDATF